MSYASEALQLAKQHGAPLDALDALRTREVLLNILEEANIEKEICEDVADTCEISDLDALAIASGLLDAEKVAEMCYLTFAEAEIVITNCTHRAFSMGITFGKDAVKEPRRLETAATPPGGVVLDSVAITTAGKPGAYHLNTGAALKRPSNDSQGSLTDSLRFTQKVTAPAPREGVSGLVAEQGEVSDEDSLEIDSIMNRKPKPVAKPKPAAAPAPAAPAAAPDPAPAAAPAEAAQSGGGSGKKAAGGGGKARVRSGGHKTPVTQRQMGSKPSHMHSIESTSSTASGISSGIAPAVSRPPFKSESGTAKSSGRPSSRSSSRPASHSGVESASERRGRSATVSKPPATHSIDFGGPKTALVTPTLRGSGASGATPSQNAGSSGVSSAAISSVALPDEEDGGGAGGGQYASATLALPGVKQASAASSAGVTNDSVTAAVPAADAGAADAPAEADESVSVGVAAASKASEVDDDAPGPAADVPADGDDAGRVGDEVAPAAAEDEGADGAADAQEPEAGDVVDDADVDEAVEEALEKLADEAEAAEVGPSSPGDMDAKMGPADDDEGPEPEQQPAAPAHDEAEEVSEPAAASTPVQTAAHGSRIPAPASDARPSSRSGGGAADKTPSPSKSSDPVIPAIMSRGDDALWHPEDAKRRPSLSKNGDEDSSTKSAMRVSSSGISEPVSPKTPAVRPPEKYQSGQFDSDTSGASHHAAAAAASPATATPVATPTVTQTAEVPPAPSPAASPDPPADEGVLLKDHLRTRSAPHNSAPSSPRGGGSRGGSRSRDASANSRPRSSTQAKTNESYDDLDAAFLKYPGAMPHFMRPTAATQLRQKAEEEPKAPARRSRSANRAVSSSAGFIRPTASYVAKVEKDKPQGRALSASVGARSSSQKPNQRMSTTSVTPFHLSSDSRPTRGAKTSDEIKLAQLKAQREEEQKRRKAQLTKLKAGSTSSVTSPTASSIHKKTTPKPFKLASVALHEQELLQRKMQQKKEEKDAKRAMEFKARPYDLAQYRDVGLGASTGSRRAGGREGAKGRGPSFLSDARLNNRRDALEGRFQGAGAAMASKRSVGGPGDAGGREGRGRPTGERNSRVAGNPRGSSVGHSEPPKEKGFRGGAGNSGGSSGLYGSRGGARGPSPAADNRSRVTSSSVGRKSKSVTRGASAGGTRGSGGAVSRGSVGAVSRGSVGAVSRGSVGAVSRGSVGRVKGASTRAVRA